ncbi:helix-turn-helix transcriptional regulator [Burkholderia oklahomensis]|uniref:Helix-turn-helix domain protein n=1 Tax=Burkholderia oklahomensis TaxID=342113 RepID=A0AAI8FS73_9BURK|nr:helix-turn-helix transcriptional regulator [Burkholderia oklahomensis]AIO70760.1 helix-turn-helix domain protein [Burkholderia oklahomensis]AJX34018.1 helix-turn-helix domain protein [Burkholderia oklahomensis C6786]AOI40254.1 AraC family transcriptional regulator [Burkholderia oklahomensis EO147]AOI49874.1 AraC family transcriptional regulator [Burkholderia oklahomensis C6786]KUY47250.1 AraC family transcriptional regulator [Burkholderia oklahomensis C6786]
MPSSSSTLAKPEVAISTLLADPTPPAESAPDCRLLRVALQDGIDVLVWQGALRQPISMNVRDDWGRVHFCCALQGRSRFSIDAGSRETEHVLSAGTGCISYTPDCSGRATHSGQIESVTVSIRPDLVRELAPNLDAALERKLDSARCCAPCRCDAEMRATAQSLSHALQDRHRYAHGRAGRPSMWLLGQSLALASLVIEAHGDAAPHAWPLPAAERQKLLRARDLLLADLSRAPTIAMLAKETGLSVLKLKRGFRQLFDHSVYGLFQQERMHEARRRLSSADMPVMTVAADMGYANASHFTAAFQKQFGVNPSAFKQRR